MYLGLDLGTSGLKGVIVDDQGHIVASHHAGLSVSRPQPGWSEQDPASWITAASQVLSKLSGDFPSQFSAIRAIGLSGQMHGATLLDSSGNVLCPAILWNDTRAHLEAEALDWQTNLKAIFGNITFAGFTAPKILWLQKHQPDLASKIAKVLLPKDYLRFWLTGEMVSEMSDASGTAWLDIAKRDWSDSLLAASGLTRDHMPHLVEGSQVSASLREDLTRQFGFASAVKVAGGAGDNAATAIGLDIVKPGTGFLSLGTSGVVFAANGQFCPDPNSAIHAFCHAVPDTWHQMGVTLSATDSLNWLSRQLGETPKHLVDATGELTSPGPELFLPFLGGERTPHNSAKLRAGLVGLGHDSDRASMTKAILEGVCFSLRECLELMEHSGGKVERLLAVGGGAQSNTWLGLAATILQRPLERPQGAENAAAIGAARLGALAIGEELATQQTFEVFEPASEFVQPFEDKYQRYLARCKLELALL